MTNVLLSRIDFTLRGANWQRSGGKGKKPEPIAIPDSKQQQKAAKPDGADVAQRLRNLGLIPG